MKQVRLEIETKLKKHNDFKVKWICQGKNTGFVGAVNKGIISAIGNYLILLNDDVEVDQNWLYELISKQHQTQSQMVASKIYLSDKKTLDSQGFGFAWRGKAEALDVTMNCSLSSASDYWLNNPKFLPESFLLEPFGADAAAALYTKEMFDKIGLLQKDFFAYLEDVELALRARQAGMNCVLAENAVAYHHKHASSKINRCFKEKQDFFNWIKLVIRRYNVKVWRRFGQLIFVERLKNFSGWIKCLIKRRLLSK